MKLKTVTMVLTKRPIKNGC